MTSNVAERASITILMDLIGYVLILIVITVPIGLNIMILAKNGKGEKREMNEDKIYEFNGKYYSETDYSSEVEDGKWGGDLYDLFWDASHGELRGSLCESTIYYSAYNPETVYDNAEELVEDFFEDDVVSLEDIKEKSNDDDT